VSVIIIICYDLSLLLGVVEHAFLWVVTPTAVAATAMVLQPLLLQLIATLLLLPLLAISCCHLLGYIAVTVGIPTCHAAMGVAHCIAVGVGGLAATACHGLPAWGCTCMEGV
jgi:hypothetical protein